MQIRGALREYRGCADGRQRFGPGEGNSMVLAPEKKQPRARAPRTVRMTLDEFLNSPDERYSEWVDGKVTYLSVNDPHQERSVLLSAILNIYVRARGIGVILTAPYAMKLVMRPSGREPDIMFIATHNLNRNTYKFLDGPADMAVEIICTDSRTRDRRDKFFEYALSGVREYWMIDYEVQRADFYQLTDYGTYDPIPVVDGIFNSLVIPGFRLRADWLWQRPLPLIIELIKDWQLL